MLMIAATLSLLVGISLVLRAAIILAVNGRGRFPFDPWVSLATGFACAFLGQALLD